MKKIMTISAVAAFFAAATALFAAVGVKKTDVSDMKDLWKKYEAARNADRPQKQLEILTEIKSAAKAAKLPVDYYDACVRYARDGSYRNWKLRDSLYMAASAEIDAYGDPMLTFIYGLNDAPYGQGRATLAFVKEHATALKASYNAELQSKYGRISGGVDDKTGKFLLSSFKDDYDCALWALWLRDYDEQTEKELRAYVGENLPLAAFMDFLSIRHKDGQFDDYLKKYGGTVYSVLAEDCLLGRRFDELNTKKAGSDDYRRLKADCDSFAARIKTYKGEESKVASCCKHAASVAKNLDSKELGFFIKEGQLELYVRNLSRVDFKLLSGKKEVWKTALESADCPYYVLDTLKMEIPDNFDDGEYLAVCTSGKIEEKHKYVRHNLSMTLQNRKDGVYIYVCRQSDGKPVGAFDYVLSNNGNSGIYSGKGDCSEGFFRLPDGFAAYAQGRGVKMECSTIENGRKRLTPQMSFYRGLDRAVEEEYISDYAVILTDCAAFNPGDTVKFKALCYTAGSGGNRQAYPAGRKIEVSLVDVNDNELGSKALKTNEFGSVAGEFEIPVGVKGGNWRIEVKHKGNYLTANSIVVDDFILPEFELSFEDPDRLYFPGDSVLVKATLKSYSGHSLSEAKVEWSADGQSGVVVPESDGRFSFSFVADSSIAYNSTKYINVKVTAGTGQTLEFNTTRRVCGYLNISLGAPEDVDKEIAFKVNVYGHNGLGQDNVLTKWEIRKDGKAVLSGGAKLGTEMKVDLSRLADGRYELYVKAIATDGKGAEREAEQTEEFVKLASDADSADFPVSGLLRKLEGENIALLVAESQKPMWAVVQLWSDGREVRHELIHLGQETETTVVHVDWKYEDSYEDEVVLSIVCFREGRRMSRQWEFRRGSPSTLLPLSFTRFTSSVYPSSLCTVSFNTGSGVEAAATVFDKATETVRANTWTPARSWSRSFHVDGISQSVCGSDGAEGYYDLKYLSGSLMGYNVVRRSSASGRNAMSNFAMEEEMMYDAAEAVPEAKSADAGAVEDGAESSVPSVRSDFREALCFEPFLRSDADGNVSFEFRTSDKLSTYVVQIFAHDKDVRNAVLRREMVVTVPVRVSLVPPAYLYDGDSWCPNVSVSSNSASDISGSVVLSLYEGGEYDGNAKPLVRYVRDNVTVKAGASMSVSFGAIPEDIFETLRNAGADKLGIKVGFIAESADATVGDASFHAVPVYDNFQTVTESHSAVLLSGKDRDALLESLRAAFVNADPKDAGYKEIKIADMVRDALPELQNPESENIFSLVDALYSNEMAAKLGVRADNFDGIQAELLKKILACVCSDGGFGWFEGMDSSPAVTAQVLWRMAKAGLDVKLGEERRKAACEYLDKARFAPQKQQRPYWCGGISMPKYMLVRSMYSDVPLAAKPDHKERKDMAEYMVPNKERGLNGMIYAKSVRLQILINLSATPAGETLASAWGVKLQTGAKLHKSVEADYLSLCEYAVDHKCGGMYFPNAVMPFRGLMESEAFVHAMLCDLFSDVPDYVKGNPEYQKIADGIRLWLMIQKETQQWGSDPGWCDALASVLGASDELLDTRVIALSASVRKPYRELRKAGNGFTLDVKYNIVRPGGSRKELKEGDSIAFGDKIEAEYSIWSGENRSFVRLSVPRPACLVPEQQLSGIYGVWVRPMRVYGVYGFSPVGYRWVRSNATEYWFESFPEEKSVVSETFFAGSNGVFSAPVPEIECLYAPHYRANAESVSITVSE